QINGYEYEILETIDCIQNGKRECPSMSHEDTLEVIGMMDSLRKEWGVRYPSDTE
ncbi:MAG: gfo/Idh/MocA family oxidoreductase, partial [Lachnospiraceae bacterium]|nr:gfo/Idh/MocA family oxidoreductase [Lachnospiraceae bacterium]